ncbi:flagellar hook-length control protein FliK [Paracoccus sp. (in: a-proteobacteria)]|uniref:flagellar hook-length control protein FliK n=1 Tax=Paracoccus sp. TaxID=267 RepID=UPI00396CD6B1
MSDFQLNANWLPRGNLSAEGASTGMPSLLDPASDQAAAEDWSALVTQPVAMTEVALPATGWTMMRALPSVPNLQIAPTSEMPQLPVDALARWLEESSGISGGFTKPESQKLPEEVELALAAMPDVSVPVAILTMVANATVSEAETLPEAGASGSVPAAAATAGAEPAETIDSDMLTGAALAQDRTTATNDAVKQAMPFTPSGQEIEASGTTPGDDGPALATAREVHASRKLTALGQSPVPPAGNEAEFAASAPSATKTEPTSQAEAVQKSMTLAPELITALPDSALAEPRIPLQQPEARIMAREAAGMAPAGTSSQPDPRPVLQQVTQALVTTRADSTEIALAPEELGRIRLVFSGHDRSQLTIWAERPETLDLVRRNADMLTQQLQEAGVETGLMNFRQDQPGTRWSESAAPLSGEPDEAAPAPATLVQLAPTPSGDRRIDVRY